MRSTLKEASKADDLGIQALLHWMKLEAFFGLKVWKELVALGSQRIEDPELQVKKKLICNSFIAQDPGNIPKVMEHYETPLSFKSLWYPLIPYFWCFLMEVGRLTMIVK